LLAATWNFTEVLAGVVADHESVVQCVTDPAAGFASRIEDVSVADGVKPADTYVWKLPSRVESCTHVPPLSADVTRKPPAYVLGEERIQK